MPLRCAYEWFDRWQVIPRELGRVVDERQRVLELLLLQLRPLAAWSVREGDSADAAEVSEAVYEDKEAEYGGRGGGDEECVGGRFQGV